MTWLRAMDVSELVTNTGKAVELEGQSVAVFNLDGKIYALQNHCMHRGGPLADGYIEDSRVTCPWHAWQFDVKTGECETMKGSKQKTFKTKIDKDQIYVKI